MNDRVLPIFALLVSVGIFFAYVNPTWSGSIAETKIKIADADRALDAAGEYEARKNELASARNAIDPSRLALLSAFLPDSVDNVGLILDLNALAARSGLSLANVDVIMNSENGANAAAGLMLPVGPNPVGSVDLSLSAIGTYPALQTFLVGVERSARLLDVRNMNIKGSDTGVYNYQMTLRLYWLR